MNVEDIASKISVIFGIQHGWKDQISGFMFPQTLARGGGITNHHLIAYSLSNISAKNYQNRLMCIEVIVCYITVGFFWDTVYCIHAVYFAPDVSVKYLDICRESVCLHISETTGPNFTNFLCICLWPWLSPSLAALRYAMYFQYCRWHHVFIWWPYGALCAFLSGKNMTAESTLNRMASIPSKFCSLPNDKGLQVHRLLSRSQPQSQLTDYFLRSGWTLILSTASWPSC